MDRILAGSELAVGLSRTKQHMKVKAQTYLTFQKLPVFSRCNCTGSSGRQACSVSAAAAGLLLFRFQRKAIFKTQKTSICFSSFVRLSYVCHVRANVKQRNLTNLTLQAT